MVGMSKLQVIVAELEVTPAEGCPTAGKHSKQTRICASLGSRMKFKTLYLEEIKTQPFHHFDFQLF